MTNITLIAWVKDSPNTVPLATAEFRSDSLALATAKLWNRSGFRVERREHNTPD